MVSKVYLTFHPRNSFLCRSLSWKRDNIVFKSICKQVRSPEQPKSIHISHTVSEMRIYFALLTVSQHNELVYSPVLRRFLFSAQQKNAGTWLNDCDLTVWLLNGTQVSVKVSYDETSENVLQVRNFRLCNFTVFTMLLIKSNFFHF